MLVIYIYHSNNIYDFHSVNYQDLFNMYTGSHKLIGLMYILILFQIIYLSRLDSMGHAEE